MADDRSNKGLTYLNTLSAADRQKLFDEMQRTDFRAFARQALHHLVPGLEWNWHVDVLIQAAGKVAHEGEHRLMVNIAPRMLKSQVFSAVLPAYLLGRNPECRIVCVSYSQDLSETLAADTLRIMDSDWYRRLFPTVSLSKRAVARIRTTEGGGRMATSVGGTITGMGGDYIIVDDAMNAADAESEALRNSTNEWLASTLFSRLDKPKFGSIVMVAQRLHQDDPCGRFMSKGDWRVLSIPMQATEAKTYDLGFGHSHTVKPGDLIHPSRFGLTEFNQQRLELGERRFEAQYMQTPVPADGAFFKRGWLLFDQEAMARQPGDTVIQSWDVAAKAGDSNDFCVCVTAIQRRSQVIVIEVLRKRMMFPELYRTVIAQAERHRPEKLLVEDASAGQQLIQMLRAEQPRGVPLPLAMETTRSKEDRAAMALARFEAGGVVLPASASWLETFTSELLSFPAGRHDDQVDAIVHLVNYTIAHPPLPIELEVDAGTKPSYWDGAGGRVRDLPSPEIPPDDFDWDDPDLPPDFHPPFQPLF